MPLADINPLWILVAAAIFGSFFGIAGGWAVAHHRIGVHERRLNSHSEKLDRCLEKLAHIEGMLTAICKEDT